MTSVRVIRLIGSRRYMTWKAIRPAAREKIKTP
jgi:hypothetical protein